MKRRLVVAVGLFFCLVGVAWGAAQHDVTARRKALEKLLADEHALLPPRPRALVDAMDDVVVDLANAWKGELVAPGLDRSLFGRSMLYVRAAQPEIARLDAIGAAVRRSDKDTVALCLVKPPVTSEPDDVHAAATRYWLGGALFDEATHDVLPLEAVHKGLRPLSKAFAAELAEADDRLALRRVEEEVAFRQPIAITLGRTAADAELLVVVVDELPEGMASPDVGKSVTATRRPAILPAIEAAPHFVRAAVWDRSGVVLRVRTRVDATRRPSSRRPEALAEMHGCQVAMALADALSRSAPR